MTTPEPHGRVVAYASSCFAETGLDFILSLYSAEVRLM